MRKKAINYNTGQEQELNKNEVKRTYTGDRQHKEQSTRA